MEIVLLQRLTALSHPQRMGIFRLLMRRYPDAVPAGEIRTALGLKASTLSAYLTNLTQAGLITQHRDGTHLYYAINLDAARAVVSDLFSDCCQGRADLCPTLPQREPRPQQRVLFLCTGNSARSLMAQAILRDAAPDWFVVFSAGTNPKPVAHPLTLATLSAQGHAVADLHPKPLSTYQDPEHPRMDFVITVCDDAANEDCPQWPQLPVSGHWGIPDPAQIASEQPAGFEQTYALLKQRIDAFISLTRAASDPAQLQTQIDQIGTLSPIKDLAST